jgi:hypothetical protein
VRLPLPAPPREKAAAPEDQTGESRADDGPRHTANCLDLTCDLTEVIDAVCRTVEGGVRAIAGACASPPRHRPVLVNSSAEWEKLEVQTRHHRLNIGMRAGYGFWYTKAIGYNLISIPDIDPSEVVF